MTDGPVEVGVGPDPSKCYICKRPNPFHVVAEVWFDFGKPDMRFASTLDWKGQPRLCRFCYEKRENEVAQAVFQFQLKAGAFGPLIPTRWWLRYAGEPSFGEPGFKPLGGFVGRRAP